MSAPLDILHGAPELEADVAALGGWGATYHESLHHDVLDELRHAELAVLRAIDGAATVEQVIRRCALHPGEVVRTLRDLAVRGVISRLLRASL
ncbi:MAG: hypothetical protein IPK07_34810 [Deltaproteobacteria bacterium]|nr:hypothetical protein [Deltaproteobacteria bacterium]